MTIFPPPSSPKKPDSMGAKKQGLFGLLFKPQIGSNIGPLRESTRIFVQLVAGVFAIYKLIPKDYPGLRDPNARLSFSNIISTAWQNIRLTREGAPQAILFFAITGVMAFSAFVAVLALLSLFVGHAHAQTVNSTSFAPESSDIAQAWISYLFNGVALPAYYTNMNTAIPTGLSLQSALITVLGFYSDAILIIAAMILFYHLTAMVVETAHHGVVMGKRANQIWAPIRLVVAIGLLVPINNGLNSGQYIVIQMAEWGSGLASQAWSGPNGFLSALSNYSVNPVPPNSPAITQIAETVMSIEACVQDYNYQIGVLNTQIPGANLSPITAYSQTGQTVDGHTGTKVSFSSDDMAGQDICGSYFIPDAPSDPAAQTAYKAEVTALNNFITAITPIAQADICSVMQPGTGCPANTGPIPLDAKSLPAVIAYQQALSTAMAGVVAQIQSQTQSAITQLQPYGWIFAGALLPMVERMQAMVSNAATAGMPEASMPNITLPENQNPIRGRFTSGAAAEQTGQINIRKSLIEDMSNFNIFLNKSWAQTAPSNPQCAAMLGLQDSSQGSGFGADAVNFAFGLIDRMATWNGVWRSGKGTACAAGTPGAGLNTFVVGIDLTGPDILTQMASLGHANIDTATDVLSIAVAAKVLGPLGGIAGAAAGATVGGPLGLVVGFAAGDILGKIAIAAGGVLMFVATIFFLCGFALAYVLPMFPFIHFFFAALSWVGAIIEAVIAVPLIALAHLTPEGDGLPGPAKGAYYFVFNIFLRPILSVFGLVCALLAFMIAASFLTYGYNLGVAASGGTAYGHEFVSKMIYSVVYVALLYVCANHAFSLISHIPDNALRWMGQQGQTMPRMGSADQFEKYTNLVGDFAGVQGIKQIGGVADMAGKSLGEAASNKLMPRVESSLDERTPVPGTGDMTQKDLKTANQMAKVEDTSLSQILGDAAKMGQITKGRLGARNPSEINAAQMFSISKGYHK